MIHDPAGRQFYLLVEGNRSYVSYELLEGGVLDLQHTIVPKAVSGRGIAGLLVQAACDYARAQGFRILATCAYAQVWLERHPGYDYQIGDCGPACSLS